MIIKTPLSQYSTEELRKELKKRKLDCYPLSIPFTSGIKWPITNKGKGISLLYI